jgi:hypothetical protein
MEGVSQLRRSSNAAIEHVKVKATKRPLFRQRPLTNTTKPSTKPGVIQLLPSMDFKREVLSMACWFNH